MNPYRFAYCPVPADTKSIGPHVVYPINGTPSSIASFIDENMLSKNTRANDYYLFLIQLISHPQLI